MKLKYLLFILALLLTACEKQLTTQLNECNGQLAAAKQDIENTELAIHKINTLFNSALRNPKEIDTPAWGAGAASCGKYIANRDNLVFLSWAQGYMSGLGVLIPEEKIRGKFSDKLKKNDSEAMEVWLQNYCKEHPFELYVSSVLDLVKELALDGKDPIPSFLDL